MRPLSFSSLSTLLYPLLGQPISFSFMLSFFVHLNTALMVSVLDSGLSGPDLSPGQEIMLCSWARHLTLTVPLSTQVYKWVLVNLMLGVTL